MKSDPLTPIVCKAALLVLVGFPVLYLWYIVVYAVASGVMR